MVIYQVNTGLKYDSNRRLDAGTQLLLAAAMDRAPFDLPRVTQDLCALRVDEEDLLRHCIPEAARALGQDWLQDRLSFAQVSTASARMFGLCKEISKDWRYRPAHQTGNLLLATIEREDHTIGPAVLTERLRRQGHSVYVMLNTDTTEILQQLRDVGYDALLFSCGSFRTLELTSKAIKRVKAAGVGLPILLGGAIVELDNELRRKTGADLVTNDIDTALDTLAKLGQGGLVAG